jgi:hypothetical protein
MKTKTTLLLLLCIVIASCSIETTENQVTEDGARLIIGLPQLDDGINSGDPVEVCTPFNLMAGQNILVGSVSIIQLETGELEITYSTFGDWQIDVTHLFIGDIADLPINGGGNPQIGQFPYSETHPAGTQSVTYTIPGLDPADCLTIAAHAEVTNMVTGQNETAWADGDPIDGNGGGNGNGGGSWAMMNNTCDCL